MKLLFISSNFVFIYSIFDLISASDPMYIFCVFWQPDMSEKQPTLSLVDNHIIHGMRNPNGILNTKLHHDTYRSVDPVSKLIWRLLNSCEASSSQCEETKKEQSITLRDIFFKDNQESMFYTQRPNEKPSNPLLYNLPIHTNDLSKSDYIFNTMSLANYEPVLLHPDMHRFRIRPKSAIESLEKIFYSNIPNDDEEIVIVLMPVNEVKDLSEFVQGLIKEYRNEKTPEDDIEKIVRLIKEIINIQQKTPNTFHDIVSDIFVKQNDVHCRCYYVIILPNYQDFNGEDDIEHLSSFEDVINAIALKISNRKYFEMECSPVQRLLAKKLGITDILNVHYIDNIDRISSKSNDIYLQSLSNSLYSYETIKNPQTVVSPDMTNGVSQNYLLTSEPVGSGSSNLEEIYASIFEPITLHHPYLDINIQNLVHLGNTISGFEEQGRDGYINSVRYHDDKNVCNILAMYLHSHILNDHPSNFIFLKFFMNLLNFRECITENQLIEVYNRFKNQDKPNSLNNDYDSNKYQTVSNGDVVFENPSIIDSFPRYAEQFEFPLVLKGRNDFVKSEVLDFENPQFTFTDSRSSNPSESAISTQLYSKGELLRKNHPQNQQISLPDSISTMLTDTYPDIDARHLQYRGNQINSEDSLTLKLSTPLTSQQILNTVLLDSNKGPILSETNLNNKDSILHFVSELTESNSSFGTLNTESISVAKPTDDVFIQPDPEGESLENASIPNQQVSMPDNISTMFTDTYPDIDARHLPYHNHMNSEDSLKLNLSTPSTSQQIKDIHLLDPNEGPSLSVTNVNYNDTNLNLVSELTKSNSSSITSNTDRNNSEAELTDTVVSIRLDPEHESHENASIHNQQFSLSDNTSTVFTDIYPDINSTHFQYQANNMNSDDALKLNLSTPPISQQILDILQLNPDQRPIISETNVNYNDSNLNLVSELIKSDSSFISQNTDSINSEAEPTDTVVSIRLDPEDESLENASFHSQQVSMFIDTYPDNNATTFQYLENNMNSGDSLKLNLDTPPHDIELRRYTSQQIHDILLLKPHQTQSLSENNLKDNDSNLHLVSELTKSNSTLITSNTDSMNSVVESSDAAVSIRLDPEDEGLENVFIHNQQFSLSDNISTMFTDIYADINTKHFQYLENNMNSEESLKLNLSTPPISQQILEILWLNPNQEPIISETNVNFNDSNLHLVSELTKSDSSFISQNTDIINSEAEPTDSMVSIRLDPEDEFLENASIHNQQFSLSDNISTMFTDIYPDINTTHFQYLEKNMNSEDSLKPNLSTSPISQQIFQLNLNQGPTTSETNVNYNDSNLNLVSELIKSDSSFISQNTDIINIEAEPTDSVVSIQIYPEDKSLENASFYNQQVSMYIDTYPDKNATNFKYLENNMNSEDLLKLNLSTPYTAQQMHDILLLNPHQTQSLFENNLNDNDSNLHLVSGLTKSNSSLITSNIESINGVAKPTDTVMSIRLDPEDDSLETVSFLNQQASLPDNISTIFIDTYPDIDARHFQYHNHMNSEDSLKLHLSTPSSSQHSLAFLLLDSNEPPFLSETDLNYNDSNLHLVSELIKSNSSFITPNTESINSVVKPSDAVVSIQQNPNDTFFQNAPFLNEQASLPIIIPTKLLEINPDFNDTFFQNSVNHTDLEEALELNLISISPNSENNVDILSLDSYLGSNIEPSLIENTLDFNDSYLLTASDITSSTPSLPNTKINIEEVDNYDKTAPFKFDPILSEILDLNNTVEEFAKTYEKINDNVQLEENIIPDVVNPILDNYLPFNKSKLDLQGIENSEINYWQHLSLNNSELNVLKNESYTNVTLQYLHNSIDPIKDLFNEVLLDSLNEEENSDSYYIDKTSDSNQFYISDPSVFQNYSHNRLTSGNLTDVSLLSFPVVNPFILKNSSKANNLPETNFSNLANLLNHRNFNESYHRYLQDKVNLTDDDKTPRLNIWNTSVVTHLQNQTEHNDAYLFHLLSLMNEGNEFESSYHINYPDSENGVVFKSDTFQNISQWNVSDSTFLQKHSNINTTYSQYPEMLQSDELWQENLKHHDQPTLSSPLPWNTTDLIHLYHPKSDIAYLQYLFRIMNSANGTMYMKYLLNFINSIEDSKMILGSHGYSKLFDLGVNQWNFSDSDFSQTFQFNTIYLQYLMSLMNSTEDIRKFVSIPEFYPKPGLPQWNFLSNISDPEVFKKYSNIDIIHLQYLLNAINSTNMIPMSSSISNQRDKIQWRSQILNVIDMIHILQNNGSNVQYLLDEIHSNARSAKSNFDMHTWSRDIQSLKHIQSPDEITQHLLQLSRLLNDPRLKQAYKHHPHINITNSHNLLGDVTRNSSLPLFDDTSISTLDLKNNHSSQVLVNSPTNNLEDNKSGFNSFRKIGDSHSSNVLDKFKHKKPSFHHKKSRPQSVKSNPSLIPPRG